MLSARGEAGFLPAKGLSAAVSEQVHTFPVPLTFLSEGATLTEGILVSGESERTIISAIGCQGSWALGVARTLWVLFWTLPPPRGTWDHLGVHA